MAQLEQIEAIEKKLWKAADTLRGNSELASNDYFLPVMGLIFLRHAYSRYLKVKAEIVAKLPSRGGQVRALTKEDFSGKNAIFLQAEAQYDALLALPITKLKEAIAHAMASIEDDYKNLEGQLPKNEYSNIPNEVLGVLVRSLNPEELKQADGDIFGRIYEYFLTQFADQGAHDGGEFFTPISLVQLIVNVIEPNHGKIFDPACGSGGMFVQSAHFMERQSQNPQQLTFYGHEKNRVTTRLAKMNLAVHGLEGNIIGGDSAITYYNDNHANLFGNVDFVMANPPFNVDEVDSDKIKKDIGTRLPFGLPSVNKTKKVSNANYLWIQYFYSYLSAQGRAGFVMSSQASSAGREEAKVREALVKTGHVDVMIDIRGNFFYTRTVPCQLWFLDKAKTGERKNKVLMLDARNVYRKVTRKIYDFSPEQQQNLTAIVWLYRGQSQRFIELVADYLNAMLDSLHEAVLPTPKRRGIKRIMLRLKHQLRIFEQDIKGETLELDNTLIADIRQQLAQLQHSVETFKQEILAFASVQSPATLHSVSVRTAEFAPLSETTRQLLKSVEHVVKQSEQLNRQTIEALRAEVRTQEQSLESLVEQIKQTQGIEALLPLQQQEKVRKERVKDLNQARTALQRNSKQLELWRTHTLEQLKQVRYWHKQAVWLLERFPEARLRDVEGLVKLVDVKDIEAADWSLTPGRYVGVAAEAVDEDFDFESTLRDIHVELEGLNQEAVELARRIAANFKGLGV